MIQAARSGKQNIIEGSMAAATSKESEIKLTGVARASLEELLADYRDFLRTRGLEEWPAEHAYALRLRKLNRIPGGKALHWRAEGDGPSLAGHRICNHSALRSTSQNGCPDLVPGGFRGC